MKFDDLTFLWFTFAGDAGCLAESVASAALTAPGARLVVVDDAAAPVTGFARDSLRGGGVEWLESTWNRGGNMNGMESLTNELRLMESVSGGAGVVVKIDSDVLIQRAGLLTDHNWSRQPVAAVTQPGWWFQGATMGVSATALPALRDAVSMLPDLAPEILPRVPDDRAIGALAAALWGGEAVGHWQGWPVGKAVAHYSHATNAGFELYRDFDTVNFGDRRRMQAPEALRRGLAADVMRAYRALAPRAPRDASA